MLAIVRCPLPVLAEIRGTAAGFGLDLALACDMRLAESGATFTSAFARMGLVPDGGSTFTLPRLVGLGHALRFLMAGETLSAARAFALGLVDEVRDEAEFDGDGHRAWRKPSPPRRPRACGRSSGWSARTSWARWSRRSPPRVPRRFRRCRAPSSIAGSRRSSPDERAPASSRPICWREKSRSSPAAAPASGSASPPASRRAGATVAIASRKPEHLAAAADELRAAGAR